MNMKHITSLLSRSVWKGKASVICMLLLAGCLQYDEGLSPANRQEQLLSDGISAQDSRQSRIIEKQTFRAHLRGSDESTPNESKSHGQFRLTLSDDGTELHYQLAVTNIENVTGAHIHCGIVGLDGPIVVSLMIGTASGKRILQEGTITSADIAAGSSCIGEVPTIDALVNSIRNEATYVNVHTTALPGGEIRGQIL